MFLSAYVRPDLKHINYSWVKENKKRKGKTGDDWSRDYRFLDRYGINHDIVY